MPKAKLLQGEKVEKKVQVYNDLPVYSEAVIFKMLFKRKPKSYRVLSINHLYTPSCKSHAKKVHALFPGQCLTNAF